ncbi:peptidoglycan-binding protein [Bacillus sp. BGMRC 2118]|nr:peptidoglycan-binding protein [Bacillus sp. BGMRC 2118]
MKGDKGASVTALQKRILALGYNLPKYGADGHFGDETEEAVKQFQRDHNINDDGIVGPITSRHLGTTKPKKKVPYPGKVIS